MVMVLRVAFKQLANMRVAFDDCCVEACVLHIGKGEVSYLVREVEADILRDLVRLAECATIEWSDGPIVRNTYAEYFGEESLHDADAITPESVLSPQ